MFGIPFGWKVKDSWQNFAALFLYYMVKWTFYRITFRYLRYGLFGWKVEDSWQNFAVLFLYYMMKWTFYWITFRYLWYGLLLAEKSKILARTRASDSPFFTTALSKATTQRMTARWHLQPRTLLPNRWSLQLKLISHPPAFFLMSDKDEYAIKLQSISQYSTSTTWHGQKHPLNSPYGEAKSKPSVYPLEICRRSGKTSSQVRSHVGSS